MLTDGSQIGLNTGTALRVEGRRTELIKGEAYFQIAHDPAHPFTVIAQGHRVTDLGTKFVVRANDARLEVSLVEGRARIKSSGTSKSTSQCCSTPGRCGYRYRLRHLSNEESQHDLATDLGWRRGVLVFHQTTLKDAVAEFNRYNRKKLVIADSKASALTIGATFPTHDVEAFSHAWRRTFSVCMWMIRAARS